MDIRIRMVRMVVQGIMGIIPFLRRRRLRLLRLNSMRISLSMGERISNTALKDMEVCPRRLRLHIVYGRVMG